MRWQCINTINTRVKCSSCAHSHPTCPASFETIVCQSVGYNRHEWLKFIVHNSTGMSGTLHGGNTGFCKNLIMLSINWVLFTERWIVNNNNNNIHLMIRLNTLVNYQIINLWKYNFLKWHFTYLLHVHVWFVQSSLFKRQYCKWLYVWERNLRISGIFLVILSCRLNSLYAGMDYVQFVLLCFVLVL